MFQKYLVLVFFLAEVFSEEEYELIHMKKATFNYAYDRCANMNQELPTIKNGSVNKKLKDMLRKKGSKSKYWILGRREGSIFSWFPNNGTMVFKNWERGYPAKHKGDCTVLKANGKWENRDCDRKARYFCVSKRETTPYSLNITSNVVDKIGANATHKGVGVSKVHISRGNSGCNVCSISYLVGTQKVSWMKAFVLCKNVGMELASIYSDEEELAVENVMSIYKNKVGDSEGYWLAGTSNGACNSDFVWLTTGKPVIYQNFAEGKPNNTETKEKCLEVYSPIQDVFTWNDQDCKKQLGYICQSACC